MEITISQIIMIVIVTLAAGILLAFVVNSTWNAGPPEISIAQNVVPLLLLVPRKSDRIISWFT